MSRLIVHAGFPKCGSSAIFDGLKQQFDQLLAQKYFILNRNFEATTSLSQAQPPLWEIESAVRDKATSKQVTDKITKALELADSDAKLILSSENLADTEKPKRLLRGIDDSHDVTAIFYMRPQVDWIPSAWKQWDMREGMTLRESVDRYFELQRPDYLVVLRAWQETLPKAKIILRPLIAAELYCNDPVRDFYNLIGATFDNSAPPVPKANANPSIDHALLHLMMRSHSLFFSGRHDSAFMFRLLDHLPDAYKRTNAPMLNQLTTSDIFDTYKEENMILARDYLKLDDPKLFVNQHFRRAVTGEPYEMMSEDQVMSRAEAILNEVFDISVPRDRLAQALRDVVDARNPAKVG